MGWDGTDNCLFFCLGGFFLFFVFGFVRFCFSLDGYRNPTYFIFFNC
jgi:hypothetical protein